MVEVTYRGGNMDGITSNAASEATLQKLLAAMGKSGGGAKDLHGAASKKTAAELKKMAAATKGATEARKGDTDATKDHTKQVDKTSSTHKLN